MLLLSFTNLIVLHQQQQASTEPRVKGWTEISKINLLLKKRRMRRIKLKGRAVFSVFNTVNSSPCVWNSTFTLKRVWFLRLENETEQIRRFCSFSSRSAIYFHRFQLWAALGVLELWDISVHRSRKQIQFEFTWHCFKRLWVIIGRRWDQRLQ